MPNDDNLQTTTAEATIVETQAEGQAQTQTSESATGQAAQATTDALIGGKFRSQDDLLNAYKELERKLGSRGVPKESMQELGLATETKAPETKTEAQQMAQDFGGDAAAQWLDKRAKEVGWHRASVEMFTVMAKEAARNAVTQTLQPVNETLTGLQRNRNEEMKEAAAEQLATSYPDFLGYAKEIGTYLSANPDVKELIESAPSKAQKAKYLRMAYLEVKESKGALSTAAAKAAGAADAKRQDNMKATSVTAGSGTGKRSDTAKDPSDQWLEDVQRVEKHNQLFGS